MSSSGSIPCSECHGHGVEVGGAQFYDQVTSVMDKVGGVGQFYEHGEEQKLTKDDKQGGDSS